MKAIRFNILQYSVLGVFAGGVIWLLNTVFNPFGMAGVWGWEFVAGFGALGFILGLTAIRPPWFYWY